MVNWGEILKNFDKKKVKFCCTYAGLGPTLVPGVRGEETISGLLVVLKSERWATSQEPRPKLGDVSGSSDSDNLCNNPLSEQCFEHDKAIVQEELE